MSAAYDTTIANLATAMSCANDAMTVAATLTARALTAKRSSSSGAGPSLPTCLLMELVAEEIRRREAHDGRAASYGTSILTDAAGHLGP